MIYSYNNVIWLNPKRNYDHITQINHNFHAGDHNTKLEKFGISSISSGQPVSFNTYLDRGRTAANNIILL